MVKKLLKEKNLINYLNYNLILIILYSNNIDNKFIY